jgi:glycosyltransferase involved in cell wall biosynthesis
MTVSSVSIVICTYNRAERLRETLAALQEMDPPIDCVVELLVVDNNSTDQTPRVIADAAADAPRYPIVALRESRQGKSFALNTALAAARGDILALGDDDVLPSTGWLRRIVEDFRARDVTFVFGKVLPRWEGVPPPSLVTRKAQDIWGPLALVDYGDEPVDYRPEDPGRRLPIGANLSFSRQAIVQIGGWRTDLGKVDNTLISGEDHEIFMRLKRAGLYSGFYDPEVTVRHFVPKSRVTRRYFRQWFFWHGRTLALMQQDLYPEIDMSRVPRIRGIPRFMFRQGLEQVGYFLKAMVSGDSLSRFVCELRLFQYAGFFVQCGKPHSAPAVADGSLPMSSPPAVSARIVKTR